MNINMRLNKEELDDIFKVVLKNALANNITINLNIDLDNYNTPVVIQDEIEDNNPTVILGKCESCGCVQAVNLIEGETPRCYSCHEEINSDLKELEFDCECGNHVHVAIMGTGVSYVSCNKCNKKHSIKFDFNQDMWVLR